MQLGFEAFVHVAFRGFQLGHATTFRGFGFTNPTEGFVFSSFFFETDYNSLESVQNSVRAITSRTAFRFFRRLLFAASFHFHFDARLFF